MITITLHGRIGKPRSVNQLRLERCLREIREYADQLEAKGDGDEAEACSAAIFDVMLDWDMLHRRRPAAAVRTVKTPVLPGGSDDEIDGLSDAWEMS